MGTAGLPLWSSFNITADQYAWALTSAYRHGVRLYDPSPANRDDPDAYEKALRDPIVRQAVDQRLRAAAGLRWTVVPYSDKPDDRQAANVVEDALKQIEEFAEARYIAAKSIFTGRSRQYIEGCRMWTRLGDGQHMNWWVPISLKEIDYRRFRYAPVKLRTPQGEETLVREELWSVTRGTWEPVIHRENFLRIQYNDEESRLGYGRGLLEAMHSYIWIKGIVLRDGLQALRRLAQGMLHVKIDGARAASTDRQNDDIAAEWLAVLKKHMSENVLVTDKLDDLELLESNGTGHQMVSFFLEYLDKGITRLINGSLLPSGSGSDAGSLARSRTEADNTASIIQFDRAKIDDNITRDLIGQFWRLNSANLAALGLADARRPIFSTPTETLDTPEKASPVIQQALASGIALRKDEVYKKLGFTQPTDQDEVIEGRMPSADPFGGLGGFGAGSTDLGTKGDGSTTPAKPPPFQKPEEGA